MKHTNHNTRSYTADAAFSPALSPFTFITTFIIIYMTICVAAQWWGPRATGVSAEGKRCMLGLRPADRVAFWEAVSCGQGLWGMLYG